MNQEKQLKFYITEEGGADHAGIRAVHLAAFENAGEADVVDRLRENCSTFMSLVAKTDDKVLGHILLTPARLIQNEGWSIEGLGLAPVGVLPAFQNLGIGTALCLAGLAKASSDGYPFVVVLGHPGYYPRFGFEPASNYGIQSAFAGVPDEAFMIKVLNPEIMTDAQGVVYYRQEFDDIT
jgi:putative acetyltransferase